MDIQSVINGLIQRIKENGMDYEDVIERVTFRTDMQPATLVLDLEFEDSTFQELSVASMQEKGIESTMPSLIQYLDDYNLCRGVPVATFMAAVENFTITHDEILY